MDIKKIKELLNLIKESDIAEIEVHEGENAVRISRTSSSTKAEPVHSVAITATPAPASAPPSSTAPVNNMLAGDVLR